MSEKLYASQWIKIKGADHQETVTLKVAALPQLGDTELKLLFDMSRDAAHFKDMSLEPAELANLVVEGLGVEKTMKILKDQKDGHTMLSMIRVPYETDEETKKQAIQLADNILEYGVKQRDYSTLLLLGRKILAHYPDLLDKYVDAILPLMKEYKYGEGGPANPISCLAFLSLQIEMKVEKYLKVHDVPDAVKRWKEYHESRRRQ